MDQFPTASAMGAFSVLRKYGLSSQPTAICIKESLSALSRYLFCLHGPLVQWLLPKAQTQHEALPGNVKAEKVPGAKHTDAKMYILFPLQEKAVTNC